MANYDELQLRVEVQDAIVGYAMNLMGQNNVPAHLVHDALVKAEARVAEYVTVEMLNAYIDKQKSAEISAPTVQEVEGEVIE